MGTIAPHNDWLSFCYPLHGCSAKGVIRDCAFYKFYYLKNNQGKSTEGKNKKEIFDLLIKLY
jgi:hypothetical protein